MKDTLKTGMPETQKESAIIYGLPLTGTFNVQSDVYKHEGLSGKVVIHSLEYDGNMSRDCAQYNPSVIMFIDGEITVDDVYLKSRVITYKNFPDYTTIANDIVRKTLHAACENIKPRFSIFTPTYNTGERILRAYESLKNQTCTDWEWVVLDDSPGDDTWDIINSIAKEDYRVKPHKLYPVTGGNVGLAKKRAASLCTGKWLVELDHDDALMSTCLSDCYDASIEYPDAGFIYTDCTEPYEDGTFRQYDSNTDGDYYARPGNRFCFGYCGHTWEDIEGKTYLHNHCASMNPLTIRFNIGMPNHTRMWRADIYKAIGGHNESLPVADDYELIVRTFLHTRFVHVPKVLYIQYNNYSSTVDNNVKSINRIARLTRDHYDQKIHDRILDLGKRDWNWDDRLSRSLYQMHRWDRPERFVKYYDEEQVMNYVYTPK